MTWSKYVRLVFQNIRRNATDLALAGVGIAAGITALFVFTALGSGVSQVVLDDVFDIRQLEVVPPSVATGENDSDSGGGLAGSLLGGGDSGPATLSADTVERLRSIDGVSAVYPKMKLTFPASIRGGKNIIGRTMVAELVADGVPDALVRTDSASSDDELMAFRDWESITCESDAPCPTGYACHQGTCRGQTCSASTTGDGCPDPTYCDERADRCRVPVPAVASTTLMEMLESNVRTALSGSSSTLARLSGLSKESLLGIEAEATFGASYLGRSERGDPVRRRVRLVGFSRQAIDLGATFPLGYVQRLNGRLGTDNADGFHSALLEVPDQADLSTVAQFIAEDDDLALSADYQTAQRAGLLITLMTLIFNLISIAILAIAAIHITHTLLMLLLERRHEIGLMRAVGATPSDIRWLVFGEATALGTVAALTGVLVGWGIIFAADVAFATWVPAFPFKPDSLFHVVWWLPPACIGAALTFAWLGALLPASRAASVDPADALTR